jgi:hypothetical protein
MRRGSQMIRRTIRSVRRIAADRRIPRPLRWLLAVSLLPIPGPVDEAVLVLVAPLLVIFYRQPMLEAWRQSE